MSLYKSTEIPSSVMESQVKRKVGCTFKIQGEILPSRVVADLRTDHAGEVGAVCIYKGVLFFSRDQALRNFAERHLATEQNHLMRIKEWLPPKDYSILLPLWRFAGFMTGALPTLFGPRAVYATIEAVETFVDLHYEEQVQTLQDQPHLNLLSQTLKECQADEIIHRDEAAIERGSLKLGFFLKLWCAIVSWGSRNAVIVCRYI